MKVKIFFFLILEVGLSVTITRDGLFDEALINPHEPSSNENLMPLTVNISVTVSYTHLTLPTKRIV